MIPRRRRRERFRGYRNHAMRPEPLGRTVNTYRSKFSRYPEQVRISFSDGVTAIYDLRIKQPAPVLFRKDPWHWKGYKYRG